MKLLRDKLVYIRNSPTPTRLNFSFDFGFFEIENKKISKSFHNISKIDGQRLQVY